VNTEAEQKQAMLAAIVTTSDDAIVSKTLDGVITTWNYAAEKIFGYTEVEAIGKNIELIIPVDRHSEEAYIISQISQGKRIDHFETKRLTKDGRLIPLSVSVSPIIDSKCRIIGASKIARDMSERQKADEKQAILAAIVSTSDDCIISKTLKGIITSWNPAATRMFGYTEAEAVGQHISLIIPTERLGEEEYIISQISSGNKIEHFETFRKTKDNRLVPISVSVSPVIDPAGNIIGASKIARDISAQLSIQKENARLYEEVKGLNEKKDEFIGLASHELKTPLTSIVGYLQILSKMITDKKGHLFVGKTLHQVKKLSSLVSDLLDVSKIEAGKLQLSIESFDLRKIVDDSIELISLGNTHHTVSLDTDLTTFMVTGDPHRIEQVIINLLTNAIRYAPDSKNVEVAMHANEAKVQVSVRDYGVGIATDQQPHIFSRFYRVEDANPTISGLGIGLYLSNEIISRHKGRIWTDSTPGVGSTFHFSLPL
jgi:PAS domain S-box-containing protein